MVFAASTLREFGDYFADLLQYFFGCRVGALRTYACLDAGGECHGGYARRRDIGLRLNHSQKATAAARLTADKKFLASLS